MVKIINEDLNKSLDLYNKLEKEVRSKLFNKFNIKSWLDRFNSRLEDYLMYNDDYYDEEDAYDEVYDDFIANISWKEDFDDLDSYQNILDAYSELSKEEGELEASKDMQEIFREAIGDILQGNVSSSFNMASEIISDIKSDKATKDMLSREFDRNRL